MGKRRMRKDVREIVVWAEARGWRLDSHLNGKNHFVLRHPNGARISLPGTSGDRRNSRNAMTKIRRLEDRRVTH